MIKALLTSLLVMISSGCWGQATRLLLQTKNKNKSAYYRPGEKITFRVKDSKRKISGEIIDFSDSTIFFRGGFGVRVNDITALYIDDKTKWWLRYKIEQLSLIAGGGYLLLNLANGQGINGDVLAVSGTLVGVGLLARWLIGHRIRIKGRTRLKIVDT